MAASTLHDFLEAQASTGNKILRDVAATVSALAAAALDVRAAIDHAELESDAGIAGEATRGLDCEADSLFLAAMRSAPVAVYSSGDVGDPEILDREAPLALAIQPLSGAADIDANTPIATIFSLRPVADGTGADPRHPFLQHGRTQRAAGFFLYGPKLVLVLTLGSGTHVFAYSARRKQFVQSRAELVIAERAHEVVVEGSNHRHWHDAIRLYVDDCMKGSDGPRERDFAVRWSGSLVADTYRIVVRGGVFLHPGDYRQGGSRGHIGLVHAASPIALLIEQAGGAATDTVRAILDLVPVSLDQKTPFIFGAAREVARITRYHAEPSMIAERAPLFGNRGLFRA